MQGPAQGAGKPTRGLFRGMVMEKLNGPTLADALRKPAGLQDVHYIRSMLFQACSRHASSGHAPCIRHCGDMKGAACRRRY